MRTGFKEVQQILICHWRHNSSSVTAKCVFFISAFLAHIMRVPRHQSQFLWDPATSTSIPMCFPWNPWGPRHPHIRAAFQCASSSRALGIKAQAHFLTGRRKRWLNQAPSVLCLILVFFWVCFVFCYSCIFFPRLIFYLLWSGSNVMSICIALCCKKPQYLCKWLTGKTRLQYEQ